MAIVFDIAIMGDSLTVDRNSRNWPILLERHLQIGKAQKVRTITFGREGQNSNWGLANFAPIVRQKPRVALIGFINDANSSVINLTKSASNHHAMIDQLQAGSPSTEIHLMTVAKPTDAAAAATFPNLSGLDAQLASIAAARGIGFIDCRAAWGPPIASEYAPGDGIHPLLAAYLRVTIPTIAAVIDVD